MHHSYVDPVLNEVLHIFQVVITIFAFIFNIALIFIVQRNARKEIGNYSILITYFSLSDIYYNLMHFLTYPIPENYGNAFMMRGHGVYPELVGVCMYLGAYGHAFPILISHFLYRLFAIKNPEYSKYFVQFFAGLVLATMISNALWFSIFYWLFHPDEESLRILAPIFNGSVSMPVVHTLDTAGIHLQALYWTGATFEGPRWCNLAGALVMTSSMILTYAIIIFCCCRINLYLKERIISAQSVRLHKQLFRSLIYQSFIPLFTSYYPAGVGVLLPLVGLPFVPISYAAPPACVTHPLLNSMLLIFTITDYRRAFLAFIRPSKCSRTMVDVKYNISRVN